MELNLFLLDRRQIRRRRPVRFGREPAIFRHSHVFAHLVVLIEMIAVCQFKRNHLGRLRDFADDFQQQRAGAAVAEVDNHVNLFRLAGGCRCRTNYDLRFRNAFKRVAGNVQQTAKLDRIVARQSGRVAEIADFRVAASRVNREEQLGVLSGLNNLPLNIRIFLDGAGVFRFRFTGVNVAYCSLPAVADLLNVVSGTAFKRNAYQLNPCVCK